MAESSVALAGLQHCSAVREAGLLTVTLNRPAAMNALHHEADLELERVWALFEQDAQLRVAILTGAGERAFCTGNDLKSLAAAGGAREFLPSGFGALSTRTGLNKPIIAAVNGAAMGGGFELCLACDIVIAAPTAVFAFPEPRVGRCAALGGSQYLPLSIGLHRAMGILLTGRRVSAQEGLQLGFVTAIADSADLLAHARQWADQILAGSPAAVRATRAVARRAVMDEQFLDTLKRPAALPEVREWRESADFAEGPLAFAQKRAPVWRS